MNDAVRLPPRGGVDYRVLGPLAAERVDGATGAREPLELGPPKQRAILAMLLLHRGRVVSNDRLVDALWADAAPPRALASLQAYVSNLRRVLRDAAGGGSPIARRAGGYVADVPEEHLDFARFTAAVHRVRTATEEHRWPDALEHVDRALGDWHGPLLEDFRDEPWVRVEADGPEELRTECREARIAALLAARRVAPALVAAQQLRAEHPLRDRACWLHMIALHLAGRTTEALEHYREHAARLDDELGLEPGIELRELEVAILRHDPALAAWPRPAGWSGATRIATPDAPDDRPWADPEPAHDDRGSLVGRDRERGVLDELVADARAGTARWLVLSGPAGIGKTRLAEELGRAAAADGGRAVWARCSDEDGAPAWWPVRQVVRALGEDPDALLVPPPGADTDEARFALYERVAALLADAASTAPGPLVVVVDDLQWADRTSVRCLAHAVGAVRDRPLVVAATLRDDEDGTAAAPLLAALARSDAHRQVTVGPLSASDVGELATRVAGEPLDAGRAEQLAARTGGNPLFVSEYARLPVAERERGDVPLAVRSVLGRRLDGLDPEVLAVLREAAVVGDVVDLPTLAAMSGSSADVVGDRLDEAADERLLVSTPDTGGYAFAHGLLRQEILAGIPATRRRRLHARAARAVADPADGERLSRRARHLVSALPLVEPSEVVDACRDAARHAERRWSSETAAEWWAEALRAFDLRPDAAADPTGRDDLLIAQVAALSRAGRGQTVLDVLDAALFEAVRAGRPATAGRLARALLRSAGAWPWTAYGEDPGPILERLAGVRRFVADDEAALVRVLATLAVGHCYDPDPTVPERLSAEALERAERLGRADVLADALVGRLVSYSGVAEHAEEGVAIAARLAVLGQPDERAGRVDAVIGRSVAGMAHLTLGDPVAAAAATADAIAESELLGLPVVRVQLRWMQGTLALWTGDLGEARRQYATAGRIHAQTELYYSGSGVLAGQALAREEGRLADVDPSGSPEPLVWGAAVAAARGDGGAAARAIDAWLADLRSWTWVTLGHLTLLAHACADAGLADRAPRLLALLEPHAGRIGNIGQVGVVGPIDLARGRLLATVGDVAGARTLLDTARDHAERTGGGPSVRRCDAALTALGQTRASSGLEPRG